MDTFISLAKQGYESYNDSQSNVSKTGGHEFNAPHHSGQDRPSSGHPADFDHNEVVRRAQQSSGGSEESSLFSSAVDYLKSNKSQHDAPFTNQDEGDIQAAHKAAYGGGDTSNLDATSLGSAAALKALSTFTSGGSGGGGSKSELISLAMAEAAKLFDQKSSGASGTKQEAVNSAGMTIMKLLVQSKSSGFIGGSNSGGLSGVMGLASHFM